MAFDAASAKKQFESFDFRDPYSLIDDLKSPCSLPMSGVQSLHEYLSSAPLEGCLNLDHAGKFFFHWANWSVTCRKQRELHAKNPERLNQLEHSLNALKRIEVWLKSPKGTISTSLHELYESYLDPRLRVSLFGAGEHDLYDREILFSDVGEAGPFTRLSAMKWFDKNIYSLFVFRKILLGFVPERQFRLGTSLTTDWWLGGSPLDKVSITIHQISSAGVLFKVHSRADFARLIHGSEKSAIVHFPMALLEKSKTPLETLSRLQTSSTLAIELSGEQLKADGVWKPGHQSEEAFFFMKASVLFKEHAADYKEATHSFEQWFSKEVK